MSAALSRLAFVVALVCGAGGLFFLSYAVWTRPVGLVESEMLFQASRIKQGFPLYRGLSEGAWELGAPPSRYCVLYPPFWPWLLAHVAPASPLVVRAVGRAINGVLFLATLGLLV